MKKYTVLKWIIFSVAIATNIFIIVNSCISGGVSANQSNVIANAAEKIINGIKPGSINNENYSNFASLIRKLFGHFGLFCFSGVFTTWTFYLFLNNTKLNYFLKFSGVSFGVGIAIAGLSEFIQIFVPGRSGSIADVGIDSAGYLIGVLLVIFILFLAKKPIFNRVKKEKSQAC